MIQNRIKVMLESYKLKIIASSINIGHTPI
jgi:hypothetical protein